MPRRVIPFVNGEYYHVFNRGVNKSKIFYNSKDYLKFLETTNYYKTLNTSIRLSYWNPTKSLSVQKSSQIEIISYCLMPNHFHFLLKQTENEGILNFMRKIQNSYTKYFNVKNNRTGPLLQGRFKAVRIETTEQLLHVSRYIHLNPVVSFLEKDIDRYRWSSYWEFINGKQGVANQSSVLSEFQSNEKYTSFVKDHKDYAIKLEEIKHLLHDPDV